MWPQSQCVSLSSRMRTILVACFTLLLASTIKLSEASVYMMPLSEDGRFLWLPSMRKEAEAMASPPLEVAEDDPQIIEKEADTAKALQRLFDASHNERILKYVISGLLGLFNSAKWQSRSMSFSACTASLDLLVGLSFKGSPRDIFNCSFNYFSV